MKDKKYIKRSHLQVQIGESNASVVDRNESNALGIFGGGRFDLQQCKIRAGGPAVESVLAIPKGVVEMAA